VIRPAIVFLVALSTAVPIVLAEEPPSWRQWGGPDRDFRAPATGLATSWTNDGPRRLWRRELGDGYSAVLFDRNKLYTMYSHGGQEVVVCLDAASGETAWEYRYWPPPYEGLPHYGDGPRSTPLIAGELLFSVGVTGRMHALRLSDGAPQWSRDLWGAEFDGNRLGHGYASSPVAHRDMVIVPVGGDSGALVAFDQKTGAVRWRSLSFRNSYSSPRILEIAGEIQLVIFMAEELIGVDPDTGELRWRYPHLNQWNHNITMPEAVGGDTIFLSSPQAGARGLRLVRDGEKMNVEEIWSTRRIQLYHAASVRDGDWIYGSTGVTSPAFMTAVNVRTGEVAWRERGFAKANCLEADGKLVILDEDGVLYLATATPEELVVHAKTQLLDRVSWTVPTLVGRTLWVRNRSEIVALDLG
jgi:outer membrane protein assembly factor BamB